ncbi:MAG: putative peptidoglycan glycosyltransferase FtsW [Chloroherpetonaceae bacterium]
MNSGFIIDHTEPKPFQNQGNAGGIDETGVLGKLAEGDIIPKKTFESLAGKLLLLLVVLLMCVGVLVVYSSGAGWGAKKFHNEEYFLWRQLAFVVLGLGIIFTVGAIDYKLFKKFSKAILVVSAALLAMLLVMKAAGAIEGAARWIGYGRFKFQASDLAKYALIMHLATMITEKKAYIKDLYRTYYPMITVILGIVGLVALEPNFSTAVVIASICFVMLFLGGVDIKHLAFTALAFVPVAAAFAIAAPYRVARLLTFVGEGSDKASYQIEQALIGLGNGGVFGLGPGASKQRELFLPASYNDFIFAVLGEEYGFIGATLIILLFVGVIICGVMIARNAIDDYGKYLAYGVTVAIGVYALVNAAVACHLVPTTGLPMPFVSYGGSAALFNAFGVGLLISISREKKRQEKKKATEVKSEEVAHTVAL